MTPPFWGLPSKTAEIKLSKVAILANFWPFFDFSNFKITQLEKKGCENLRHNWTIFPQIRRIHRQSYFGPSPHGRPSINHFVKSTKNFSSKTGPGASNSPTVGFDDIMMMFKVVCLGETVLKIFFSKFSETFFSTFVSNCVFKNYKNCVFSLFLANRTFRRKHDGVQSCSSQHFTPSNEHCQNFQKVFSEILVIFASKI